MTVPTTTTRTTATVPQQQQRIRSHLPSAANAVRPQIPAFLAPICSTALLTADASCLLLLLLLLRRTEAQALLDHAPAPRGFLWRPPQLPQPPRAKYRTQGWHASAEERGQQVQVQVQGQVRGQERLPLVLRAIPKASTTRA